MLVSDIPEFKNYPRVLVFLADHLSMQFGDVRSMLRLPLPNLGIEHACNFASAATLCNLVSGISVSLFIPAVSTRVNRKGEQEWIGTGQAFRKLLKNFYPWERCEDADESVRVLYDLVRNSFAHALGVHGKSGYQIGILRISTIGLSAEQLDEIERSPARPNWLSPGISGSGKAWKLLAEGFYRDVFHMLWNLARCDAQMEEAEKRFSEGTIIWRSGKP